MVAESGVTGRQRTRWIVAGHCLLCLKRVLFISLLVPSSGMVKASDVVPLSSGMAPPSGSVPPSGMVSSIVPSTGMVLQHNHSEEILGTPATVGSGNSSTPSIVKGNQNSQDRAVSVTFSKPEITLEIGAQSSQYVVVILSEALNSATSIFFTYDNGRGFARYSQQRPVILPLQPITFNVNDTNESFEIIGQTPGSVSVGVNFTTQTFSRFEEITIRIRVVQSLNLSTLTYILGWVYFACWSVSFYPQAITNWSRKSVVGFSFDYLGYSISGFSCYFMLEGGLFFIEAIQRIYLELHPGGVIPVQISDVIYPLHAIFILTVICIQCLIYERGKQTLSTMCRVALLCMGLFVIVNLILASCDVISWLTFLYWVSYIKLFTAVFKYLPQLWLNYSRQSTEGWSIFMVLFDFSGGFFNALQMLLIAYNHGDWSSLGGNITKLGLALISCMANIMFFIQHFILYRNRKPGYLVISNTDIQAA